MILTAWAEGVGSNWTGFGGMESVRRLVALPDGYEVFAVIPFGYPTRPVKGIKKRKPRLRSLQRSASAPPFA